MLVAVRELGMQKSGDREILRKAKELERVLLTRDKDFGEIVFLTQEVLTGVIFLRMNPHNQEEVHDELRRLMNEHPETELKKCFCVVEAHRHRIRKLK